MIVFLIVLRLHSAVVLNKLPAKQTSRDKFARSPLQSFCLDRAAGTMSIMPSTTEDLERNTVFSKDGQSSNNTVPTGFDHPSTNDSSGFDYRLKDESLNDPYGDLDEDDLDKPKSTGGGLGFEVGYLPPDQRPGLPSELLSHLVETEIDEDTEAAEALRANASVKVGKVGKAARSIGAQSVRKAAKRLTLRGSQGIKRGKPPRVPPGMTVNQVMDDAPIDVIKEEEEYSHSAESEKGDHGHDLSVHDDHYSHQHGDGSTSGGEDGGKLKPKRHTSLREEGKDIPDEVVAATMEAGKKLMGSIDPHNMLQLQRWRRKHKKGKKGKRKSYVKGKVIDGRHELYTLSIAVMLGVRTSIARTNTIIATSDRNKMLTPQDFMAEEKYEFAPKGSATTPPHKLSHTFKFKDYAPVAFAYLRRMFGVNEFDFLLSVCGNANFIEFISNAKSGQFFFYSQDGKYMIKTMTNAESKFLRRSKYGRHNDLRGTTIQKL